MALITCPECTHNISSQATSCPHCGMPIKQVPTGTLPIANKPGGCRIGCGLMIIICLVVAFIGDGITGQHADYSRGAYNTLGTGERITSIILGLIALGIGIFFIRKFWRKS